VNFLRGKFSIFFIQVASGRFSKNLIKPENLEKTGEFGDNREIWR